MICHTSLLWCAKITSIITGLDAIAVNNAYGFDKKKKEDLYRTSIVLRFPVPSFFS